MNILRIDNVDVFLDNKEFGKGKITISDNYNHNFSYYWGAMGDTLEDFIIRINDDYFVGCLGVHGYGKLNCKKTISELRKHLNETFYNIYPWYKHQEFQKDLRVNLTKLSKEEFSSDDGFYLRLKNFLEYDIDFYLIEDYNDRKNVEKELKDAILGAEFWHFFVYDEPQANVWLRKFHKKLVKELKKQKKLQLNER